MLNKICKVSLALALILLLNVNFCFAETQTYDFCKEAELVVGEKVATINKKSVTMDQAAYIDGGRTMVPFRFLGEALGANVSWDAAAKQAKLSLSGVEVTVTVGSLNGVVNGDIVKMDVPAVNKEGRLFIPLRFVSENLGALVNYDSETKGITVSYADTSNWKTYEAPNNLTYKYPAAWTIAPSKDDQNVVQVTSPNGSQLVTYYDDKKPGDLISSFKTEYAEEGWSLGNTFLEDENNANIGYELVFSKPEKDGSFSYLRVFVDPLDSGSNIGVCRATQEADDMDSFIFYKIVAS